MRPNDDDDDDPPSPLPFLPLTTPPASIMGVTFSSLFSSLGSLAWWAKDSEVRVPPLAALVRHLAVELHHPTHLADTLDPPPFPL